jgi:hypothetical protein
MDHRRALTVLTVVAAVMACLPSAASSRTPPKPPAVQELVTFAAPGCMGACGSGSTIGPDKALYVTDGPGGRVVRIDPKSGAMTTYASGLPRQIPDAGVGGAMDVAFSGRTAYVLVTVVGPALGQPDVIDGIYRVRRDGSVTAIADIGTWSIDNPPPTDFFVASGVQYAMEASRGGFIVTDGHHNRVLRVSKHGDIKQLIQFGNIVPTGLETDRRTIYVSQAGPVPHLPQNGKIVRFTPGRAATDVASGAPLLVDVEFGPWCRLYGLSQGIWEEGPEGSPASANTGHIVRVTRHGGLAPVAGPIDRPTSFEFIGDTAFVVTLTGKVMRIAHVR